MIKSILKPKAFAVSMAIAMVCFGLGLQPYAANGNPCYFPGYINTVNASCGSYGSATVQCYGGSAPYTYHWSNGYTGQTLSASPGSYSVTAYDSYGCHYYGYCTIYSGPSSLYLNCSSINSGCAGGYSGAASVSATGGYPPYSYAWSNGGSGHTITGLAPGNYTVTVTDYHGCYKTCYTTVYTGGNLYISCSATPSGCYYGSYGGSATVSAVGGYPPYSYSWSNGSSSKTITGLSPGYYYVTVYDIHNCSKTCYVHVGQTTSIYAYCNSTPAGCNYGGYGGTASCYAYGGYGPYTYYWSNGATSSSITGLSSGTYYCTVTDYHGCTYTAYTTVYAGSSMYLNCTSTSSNCSSYGSGTASVYVSGGAAPYSYHWSTGHYGSTITGLNPGTYHVTVYDSYGCYKSCYTTISGGASSIAVTGYVTDATDSLTCDGSIDISASGGTGPYTYAWSDGSTDEDPSGLCHGTYDVTVTDANGCSGTGSWSVGHVGYPGPCPQITSSWTHSITEKSATCAWTTVTGCTGYELRGRNAAGGAWITRYVNSPTIDERALVGLKSGESFEWQVRAVCPGGMFSDWTALASFSTYECMSPDPLTSANISTTSAELSWTATPDAAGYVLQGQRIGSSTIVTLPVGPAQTMVNPTSLKPNVSFNWRVATVCVSGERIWSSVDNFATLAAFAKTSAEAIGMEVFPNPVVDGLVRVTVDAAEGTLRVFDLVGKQIHTIPVEGRIQEFRIDEAGTYLVEFTSGGERVIQKVIVQ